MAPLIVPSSGGRSGALARNAERLALAGILALGAWLRLWHIEAAQFNLDQAGIYLLAQEAVARRAVPITGIVSSIGTFNPPTVVYLYLPSVLLGAPVVGAVGTALANLIAVALAYVLARRAFGRGAALLGALLFAVAYWPVLYSRYVWQQNLLPLGVLCLILLIASGVAAQPLMPDAPVGRCRAWLAWALPVWGVLVQLHPTAAPLGALVLLGWMLAPQTVTRRDALIGGAAFGALFVPTLLWEWVSRGYDVSLALAYLRQPTTTGPFVVRQLLLVSGLPESASAAPSAGRSLLVAWSRVLPALGLLYLAGGVLWRLWLARDDCAAPNNLTVSRGRWHDRHTWHAWLMALQPWLRWMRAPQQRQWRLALLVIAWPTLIVLGQVHHGSTIYPSYLIATFPAQFLAAGVLLRDAFATAWTGRRSARPVAGYRRGLALRLACAGLLAAVVLTLVGAQVATTPATEVRGPGEAQAEMAALREAQTLVQREHIALVTLTPGLFMLQPMTYLLRSGVTLGAPAQVIGSGSCLPVASGTGATLSLFSGNLGSSEDYLRRLPGVTDRFARTAASPLFRAYVASPTQLAAHLAPLVLHAHAAATPAMNIAVNFGGEMDLASVWMASFGAPAAVLALRYSALAPAANRGATYYGAEVTHAAVSASTTPTRAPQSNLAGCGISRWFAGQGVYFFFPTLAQSTLTQSAILQVATVRTALQPPTFTVGSLPLETAFDLPTVAYLQSRAGLVQLPVQQCGAVVLCHDGRATLLL